MEKNPAKHKKDMYSERQSGYSWCIFHGTGGLAATLVISRKMVDKAFSIEEKARALAWAAIGISTK